MARTVSTRNSTTGGAPPLPVAVSVQGVPATRQRDAFLDDSVTFWQSYSSRPLTPEDARQAVENISGFFATLQRWAMAPKAFEKEEQEAAA